MSLLISVITIVILLYVAPLILIRLKTKKVKVKYISLKGQEVKTTLYLPSNDPLWKSIKAHKEGVDEPS